MKKPLSHILNLVYPQKCLNCSKPGKYLCADCLALINISRQLPSRAEFKYLDTLYSAASYNQRIVQSCLHLLKYGFLKELSETLAYLIIAHFQLLDKQLEFPNAIITAVPLHKSRLKQRGFNQSEEIAKHLANFLNIPYLAPVLFKIKKTPPQTSLSKEQRKKNVLGCFKINPQAKKAIKGKTILLIDDVFTTGTTLEECAKILKQNSVQKVIGLVVARD